MSDVRIERIEGPRMQEWQDVAFGVSLETATQRELRQLAATFGEGQVLTPKQHLAIEKAVLLAQNQEVDKPLTVASTPARLIIRPEMVIEIYGRNLPNQAQFAYPKEPRFRRTNPLAVQHPGAIGAVRYFKNL